MLSCDLQSLRHRLTDFRHGGIQLSSNQVEAFVRVLKSCEDQARALERSMAPANGQLTPDHLADDKVKLFPVAARPRPARVVVLREDDGGDAA